MEAEAMLPDRQMAIEAMQSLGWNVKRTKPSRHVIWEFTRADTGGLWDLVKCKQGDLSMRFVARIAQQYHDAPDLVREIHEAEDRWMKARFFGLYQRAMAQEDL